MDLARVKNAQKLNICRRYYYAGFFFLPFFWFINSLWFFNEAFRKAAYEQQKQIRSYVIRSIIGTVVWIGIIVTWQVVYQMERVHWGLAGEQLTLLIPLGIE